MSRYRLSAPIWRYIEHELYQYDQNRRDLEEFREDVLEGTPKLDNPGGSRSGPGDPTASKGMRLVSSSAIVKTARDLRAIDRALRRLTEDHRAIYELFYRENMPWERVTIEMPTSRRSFFRLRRELVFMVASEMGFRVGTNLALLRDIHVL